MKPQKFIKKPIIIEAMQLTRDNYRNVFDWIVAHGADVEVNFRAGILTSMEITSLGHIVTADDFDWIIRGIKGEFYPCKPDIFSKTYDSIFGTTEVVKFSKKEFNFLNKQHRS